MAIRTEEWCVMKLQLPCTILGVCLSAGAGAAADQEEIVSLCRDGHLQARAAIRQLSCDMEVRIPATRMPNPYTGKMESQPAEVQHFSWWEDQDVARCTASFGGITEDFLWRDNTLKTIETVNQRGIANIGIPVGRLDGPDAIGYSATTAWGYALFFRPEQIREMMSPQKVVSASEEVQGNKRLYKISINYDNHYLEDVFFDPGRNYVVSKSVTHNDLQDLASQHIHEVSRFTEPKPGIYFPASVKHTSIYKGKTEANETVVFLNVRVNETIDSGKLQLRFPAGTQVTDTRRGKAYTVGDDEQPIGPETPVGKPGDLAGERFYPTAMQPAKPWATIALWTTAGFVVLALLLIIRRRRAVRDAP